MAQYKDSFLICFNNDNTGQVFHSGLPIGTFDLITNKFEIHQTILVDGSKKEISLDVDVQLRANKVIELMREASNLQKAK